MDSLPEEYSSIVDTIDEYIFATYQARPDAMCEWRPDSLSSAVPGFTRNYISSMGGEVYKVIFRKLKSSYMLSAFKLVGIKCFRV